MVGAGVVGVACAYELARAGAEVVVLDAGRTGDGASKGNTGWVSPSFSYPLAAPGVIRQGLRAALDPDGALVMRPALDASYLRWLWRFRARCTTAPVPRGDDGAGVAELAHARAARRLRRRRRAVRDARRRAGGRRAHRGRPRRLPPAVPRAARRRSRSRARRARRRRAGRGRARARSRRRGVRPALPRRPVRAPRVARPRPRGSRGRAGRRAARGRRGRRDRAHRVPAGGRRRARRPRRDRHRRRQRPAAATLGVQLPILGAKGYSITATGAGTPPSTALYLAEAKVGISGYDDAVRIAGVFELPGRDTRWSRSGSRRSCAVRSATWPTGGPTRRPCRPGPGCAPRRRTACR